MDLKLKGRRALVTRSGIGGHRPYALPSRLHGNRENLQSYLSELTTNLHAAMALLARMDAPVIAAVNGTAAGAGLGLVLAADIVIASRSAKFSTAYTGVALTPDAGCTFMLPRVIGYKHAMELFLTNRILSADQALA